jgi:hypothetical protein
MTRKWIAEAAVGLYPAEVRAVKGDELVGTLLDAGAVSLAAFLGELVSVIVAALALRSGDALAQPLGELASDSVRWGAVITVVSAMAADFVERVHWGAGLRWATVTSWQQCLAPAVIVTMFVLGRDRLCGLAGLSWCVDLVIRQPQLGLTGWISWMVLPIMGFGAMVSRPRRQTDLGHALVLIPVLAWALFRWTELGQHSGAGYFVPALAAVVLLPVKPALTLGTALTWSLLGAAFITTPATHFIVLAVALFSCMPIAVGLVALSRRVLPLR